MVYTGKSVGIDPVLKSVLISYSFDDRFFLAHSAPNLTGQISHYVTKDQSHQTNNQI